jgi:hypothetical protein
MSSRLSARSQDERKWMLNRRFVEKGRRKEKGCGGAFLPLTLALA